MSKLCLRSSNYLSASLRSAAGLELPARSSGRLAGLVLPATQHLPAGDRYGQMALRARMSPSFSLFNRLEGFVYQLQQSRDFFAEWPQRLCAKIRQRGGPADGQPPKLAAGNYSAADANCWNGRDFGGYTKPQVQFGQTITSMHPEVPMSQPESYNTMVLNFVSKLKEIGFQLARKATRSPSYSLYSPLDSEALSTLVRGDKPAPAATGGHQQAAANQRPGGQQEPASSTALPLQLQSKLQLLVSSEQQDPSEMEDEEEPRADASAHDESLAAAGNSMDSSADTEDGPEGGPDGPDGASADRAEEEEEEEDEGEPTEPDPLCKNDHCTDLFNENGIPVMDVTPVGGGSNSADQRPAGQQNSFEQPADTVALPPVRVSPGPLRPIFMTPKYPISVDPPTYTNGELQTNSIGDYVERQAQSSTPSSLLLSGLIIFFVFASVSVPLALWLMRWPLWKKQTSSV